MASLVEIFILSANIDRACIDPAQRDCALAKVLQMKYTVLPTVGDATA